MGKHIAKLESRSCRQIQELHVSFDIKERRKQGLFAKTRIQGFEIEIQGLEIEIQGFETEIQGFEIEIQGFEIELIFALRTQVSEIRAVI